jgi:hypothetical protein
MSDTNINVVAILANDGELLTKAVAEIEKLRAENEIMVGMINDMATIVIKARAALGEKE